MFPARAGMSRPGEPGNATQPYVPRASGDEPLRYGVPPLEVLCSPRERG